jgi:hypothetical protein
VTVTAAAPPPTGSAFFRSDWTSGTGNTTSAVQDGGKWNQSYCSHNDVLAVVPGSTVGWTATANVLQVTNRGETRCWQIETTNSVPQGQSYYIRFYAMVDNENQTNFHPVAVNVGDGVTPTQMSPWSIESPTTNTWQVAHRYSRLPYNDYGWKAAPGLQRRVWYRFEYFVELLPNARFRVWPRVYDMAGNLVLDARNYTHLDGGSRTLQQFHDGGGTSPYHSLDALRRFGVGYEGSAGASASGGRWYYAAVEIRGGNWVGPVQ